MKQCSRIIGTLLIALPLLGCPPKPGQTRALVMLSGDANGKALVQTLLGDKSDVNVGDIEDFFVTVTDISLDTNGGSATAFSGSMEVNLLDLTGVSQVITDAMIAPGTYTKIRLSIESPRMYLKAQPDIAITDIQLTANGRLFVSQTFEVPEGQTSLILLDFGGLKVVAQGNGGYTLTPQLQVALSVENASVTATGTVVTNDATAHTLVLNLGTTEVNVDYAAAQIFRPGDTTTPTGVASDLATGVGIQVDGLLQADGSIAADIVTIQP